MNFQPALSSALALSLVSVACVDRPFDDMSDGESETDSGDGDGDGETDSGDGDGDGETDSGDGDGDSGDGDSGDGDSGTGVDPESCATSCAETAPDGCLSSEDCLAYCELNAPDWTPEIAEAFATCAAENPLCFMSIEACVLDELHPPGTPRILRLSGAGFDAHEGKIIYAWGDPQSPTAFGDALAIDAGAFAFEWVEPVFANADNTPLILIYVDLDEDEVCTPADLTTTAMLDWNGDFLDPVFEAEIGVPQTASEFVCDFLP